MRVRLPFAGVFSLLLLLAAYAGLSSLQLDTLLNDKLLHFFTFFALTLAFYWILDTNRRRTLNLTLSVCTGALGVGSEFLQAVLPNGRAFDAWDIVANVTGSLAGVGLCTWYHKRMLERKRVRKGYGAAAGEDDADLELRAGGGLVGERDRVEDEEAVVEGSGALGGTEARRVIPLEQEVNKWDENGVDKWQEADDSGDVGTAAKHEIDVDGGKKRVG